MKPTETKLRSILKWHGGKAYLARRIVELFPPHRAYVEPFAGGLSVLLNKPPAAIEVAGDVHLGLVSLYKVLRSRPVEFAARLAAVEYSRESFDGANSGRATDEIDAALRFLIRNRMSRGGLGRDIAWSERLRGKRRPDGPVPGDLNAWETIKAEIPAIARRLRDVEFHEGEARVLIRKHDDPDTLFYCDPPYVRSTRTARQAYAHEMDDRDHIRLLDALMHCRGTVVLSGYASELYDSRLTVESGWHRTAIDMPNHAGQGKNKQRRTEVLWVNPSVSARPRQSMFQFAG